MISNRNRLAVILPVAVVLNACASVQTVKEPSRFIAEAHPAVVYVVHRNRAQLAIESPRVSGDTLVGTWQGRARPIAIPLSEVTGMAARQRDAMRTTFLAVGVATLAGVGIFAIVEKNSGEELNCSYHTWPPVCRS
jgi:hypothetical protein